MICIGLGVIILAGMGLSAIQTFVMPRAANTRLTKIVFQRVAMLFRLYMQATKTTTYSARDAVLAMYAPLSLVALVVVWFALALIGYALIYWGWGVSPWQQAFKLSGSSLFTLGFVAPPDNNFLYALAFSEAGLGMGLIALLIAYLPTMYAAFSNREKEVALLEVRAGDPPSAITMIERFNRLRDLSVMGSMWADWEVWFSEIEESHTSLGPLIFFRSPKGNRSWVTTAGAVLDGAALYASTLDLPTDPRANLCIRAGSIALRAISDFFDVAYNPDPAPDDPISISREEFDQACDRLASLDIPLKPDREQAWRDFAGWRVNYDMPLVMLARFTFAPPAPWSSDRTLNGDGSRMSISDTMRLWQKR